MYKESQNMVLKPEFTKEIVKDIIALANSNAGTIYIGIDNNGEVVGLKDVEKDLEELKATITDDISFDISLDFSMVPGFICTENIDGKDVIKLDIREAINKPVYLKKDGYKISSVFVRRGETSVEATEDDINKMLENDKFLEDNISSNQDLHFEYLKKILEKNNMEANDNTLKALHIVTLSGKYTNIGYLFSDECPYNISFVIYDGNNENEIKDNKKFTGSLLKQLNDAFEFLDTYGKDQVKIANQIEKLKLGLFNSVAYRDYYKFEEIKNILVKLFDDHYEISSLFGGAYKYIGDIFRLVNMDHRKDNV